MKFNPNLKQLVTCSNDSVVMVWNFKKNLRPFKFAAHTGPVYAVDINPTGNLIASGSSDKTI